MKYERIWAEVDLDAIHENVEHMMANVSAGVKLIAVVKSPAKLIYAVILVALFGLTASFPAAPMTWRSFAIPRSWWPL